MQAILLAYIDNFRMLAFLCLLCILAALLFKKVKGGRPSRQCTDVTSPLQSVIPASPAPPDIPTPQVRNRKQDLAKLRKNSAGVPHKLVISQILQSAVLGFAEATYN